MSSATSPFVMRTNNTVAPSNTTTDLFPPILAHPPQPPSKKFSSGASPSPIHSANGNNNNNNNNGHQPPNDSNPWNGAFTKTFMVQRSSFGGSEMDSTALGKPYSLLSKLSVEFVGTLLFVFLGSLSSLYATPNTNAVIHAAFAHGLAIFVLVTSLGHISGGHFNPAVSLGVAISGKMNPLVTVFYWAAQLAGGLCGSLLVWVVTSQEQFDSIAGGATIVPPTTLHWHQALVAEVLLTGLLVQTVLTSAVDTAHNTLAPLAIGMTVALDIFAGASISGASMNPARSFGPCFVASLFLHKGPGTRLSDPLWSLHYIYWAGPFFGAVLAALIYRGLLGRGDNRIFD